MYSSLKRRKGQIIKHLFPDKKISFTKSKYPLRYSLSVYVKCALGILIIYYLNLLIGFRSVIWLEKSFEDEYHLQMSHIDVTKIEENPEAILGPPKNYLSNQFLIENEYLCGRSADPSTRFLPHLIIFVKSTCEHFEQRQSIRLTWGEKTRLFQYNIRLAFVLGTNALNTTVEKESQKYGDIIQIDQIDYYYYNSYKMVMMLRWIDNYCSTKSVRSSYVDLRKYVLFVDDDYYIDLNHLLTYLREIDDDPEMTTYERRVFTTGELIDKSRPSRFVNDRYYISIIDYPYNLYPPYLSSECFLMTRYSARLFYIASKYTRLFHFDQIYMGLLAYSMSIQLIQNNEMFSTSLITKKNFIWNETIELSRWKRFLNRKMSVNSGKKRICYRGYRGEKLIEIWNEIHQTNLTLSFD